MKKMLALVVAGVIIVGCDDHRVVEVSCERMPWGLEVTPVLVVKLVWEALPNEATSVQRRLVGEERWRFVTDEERPRLVRRQATDSLIDPTLKMGRTYEYRLITTAGKIGWQTTVGVNESVCFSFQQ